MKNVGDLALSKGEIRDGVSLHAWDSVQECNPDTCPVIDKCNYLHVGKCKVQLKYLETLYTAIDKSYKYLDEAMLFKVGMQIVPLYTQLMKLQIVELALPNPMIYSAKGQLMVHPVYKEIRDTLKTIAVMWKDLHLSFEFSGKPNPSAGSSSSGEVRDFEKGDPTYYKKISAMGESRKGVVR
jgi:hypothetical protein